MDFSRFTRVHRQARDVLLLENTGEFERRMRTPFRNVLLLFRQHDVGQFSAKRGFNPNFEVLQQLHLPQIPINTAKNIVPSLSNRLDC